MRTLCDRLWNLQAKLTLREPHSWDPRQRTTWSRVVTSDFNSVLHRVCSAAQCAYNHVVYRPYAYDVTEGRPRVLGVKRSTVTWAIAKHTASRPTPACHIPPGTDWGTDALCQHNMCAQRDMSWPPAWRRYGDVTSMHKVYCGGRSGPYCNCNVQQWAAVAVGLSALIFYYWLGDFTIGSGDFTIGFGGEWRNTNFLVELLLVTWCTFDQSSDQNNLDEGYIIRVI